MATYFTSHLAELLNSESRKPLVTCMCQKK